jgi:hypothetical protein
MSLNGFDTADQAQTRSSCNSVQHMCGTHDESRAGLGIGGFLLKHLNMRAVLRQHANHMCAQLFAGFEWSELCVIRIYGIILHL